ncbi:MAG TPA: hypothetical protein ENH55_16715 [Aurantimonas coralicida]|uniref:FCP1 homology domain-containing protein n=1 Tax=marine sediment metagenome TaxID=412755 RepID=A0A0F9RBT9_9ZZZZ|nr:hypothetical protein [Aurantimonas coralicida]
MPLPIFIDIDGTLTDSPHKGGSGLPERIAAVEALIARGREVVLWSACGTDYVRDFAKKYGLRPIACIGKPDKAVDDRPTIRPAGSMPVVCPEDFFDCA